MSIRSDIITYLRDNPLKTILKSLRPISEFKS